MRTPRWRIVVFGLLVIGLPLAGHWARHTAGNRCAFDGARIDRLYRVRVVDDQGHDHEFCCIHCAALWLSHQERKPHAVFVTDEATGQEIDAASAWFVRSAVVTVAHTANRIHAFRKQADAARHADTAQGWVLLDGEKPFQVSAN
jgi:hypothetical protein